MPKPPLDDDDEQMRALEAMSADELDYEMQRLLERRAAAEKREDKATVEIINYKLDVAHILRAEKRKDEWEARMQQKPAVPGERI